MQTNFLAFFFPLLLPPPSGIVARVLGEPVRPEELFCSRKLKAAVQYRELYTTSTTPSIPSLSLGGRVASFVVFWGFFVGIFSVVFFWWC